MQIVDFTASHIEQAARIAKQNYENERGFVLTLPPIDAVPDLTPYVKNGLGVAALEGDTLLGFLCAIGPFNNAFGSTDATGVFSPMGANAAISKNRANVYARMYQAAGEKWVRAGASSHAVCLYAHDTETQGQFFRCGFGLRCIDAIRGTDGLSSRPPDHYTFSRVASEHAASVLPLDNMLDRSYTDSPFFMFRAGHSTEEWLAYWQESRPVCLIAKQGSLPVAFILAEADGENFLMQTPGYRHITGLFCLPEHRGTGVSRELLSLLIQTLKADGCSRLGVDYESFNPSGSGFWKKHFTAYTHSVVRRIDEYAAAEARKSL
jgi:GNAT superfamily N-acetyltransferase